MQSTMSKSIYDIKLSSYDGSVADMLSDRRGKVTLFTNVTADCGNSPQFGVLEEIYQKYRDQDFEIIAIPTNEYCGTGVTYGQWVDGISCAADAQKFAKDTYNVSYTFSEMCFSKPHPDWHKSLPEGADPHEIFEALTSTYNSYMFGNFEKYLVGKDGNIAGVYPNYWLLNKAYRRHLNKIAEMPILENEKPIRATTAFYTICADIEKALSA